MRDPRRLVASGIPVNSSSIFQFVVRLYSYQQNIGFCGGVLISKKIVVTAAHCVSHVLTILAPPIFIGIGNIPHERFMDVEYVVSHPKYNHTADAEILNGNDIALLVLRGNTNSKTVIIDDGSYWSDERTMATPTYVIGFGSDYLFGPQSNILRFAPVFAYDKRQCEDTFPYRLANTSGCAGMVPYDACTGDSGSALVMGVNNSFVLIGIVSWGLDCGLLPGVYTRIASFLEFIRAGASSSSSVVVAPPRFVNNYTCKCSNNTTCRSNGFHTPYPCTASCDTDEFCYVEDICVSGKPSVLYPGASWSTCSDTFYPINVLPNERFLERVMIKNSIQSPNLTDYIQSPNSTDFIRSPNSTDYIQSHNSTDPIRSSNVVFILAVASSVFVIIFSIIVCLGVRIHNQESSTRQKRQHATQKQLKSSKQQQSHVGQHTWRFQGSVQRI